MEKDISKGCRKEPLVHYWWALIHLKRQRKFDIILSILNVGGRDENASVKIRKKISQSLCYEK